MTRNMHYTQPHEAAFPRPCGTANREEQNLETYGLTAREWYAGQALMGLLANQDTGGIACSEVARLAFAYADAMLAEAKRPLPAPPTEDNR